MPELSKEERLRILERALGNSAVADIVEGQQPAQRISARDLERLQAVRRRVDESERWYAIDNEFHS